MTDSERPVLAGRSFLFVPGNRADRFGRAVESGSDWVIIDLEDAVADHDKDAGRSAAAAYVAGSPALVRVNGVGTVHHGPDLDVLHGCALLAGVVVPKAEEPAELTRVHRELGVPVVALIETARGLLAAPELARAPGVVRLALGNLDLRLDLGILTADDELEPDLGHPRSCLVVASAAAGLDAPIDGVCAAVHDPSVLLSSVKRALGLGMGAKLCVHPEQVAVVNETFAIPAPLLAWARSVRAAQHGSHGSVVTLDGQMLDRPQFERAARILRLAAEN